MKNIVITTAMMGEDATSALEKIIADAPDGATVTFESGVYSLPRTVMIEGKRDLTLEGTGAILSPYFSLKTGVDDGACVFELLECKNLTIRGFKVASAVPVNTGGTVVNATEEYVDVDLHIEEDFKGDELIIDAMIFDDDWYPTGWHWAQAPYDESKRAMIAKEIPCAAPKKLDCPHEMLSGKRVRIYSQLLKCYDWAKSVATLKPGTKCNLSHSYYGLSAFTFRQCDGVLIENVTMANFGGFGFTILPCCRDFTFRGLRFATDHRERQPYALNSDGIHTVGLAGKLIIEDCELDCIGDDKLNVHTQAMTVTQVGKDGMTLIYDKKNGEISPYWSEAGDVLRIYNPTTLELKGKVKITSADRGNITFEPHSVDIKEGDYVSNDKYYPDVILRNCTFWRNRGRHIVLQGTDNLLIENCTFNNGGPWAVYLSSAFEYWLEVGPLSNATIRNNLFRDVRPREDDGRSTVFVRINGKSHQDIPPIHKNITIENNRFENICGRPIAVQLTDGVRVQNNTFINCQIPDVDIQRCINVICENNK